MSSVDDYGGDLAERLYQRYSGVYANVHILDRLIQEDAVVALIQFLFLGLERKDLQPDEVGEAIELARAGKLLKSSAWLLEHLTEYQKRVLRVA
jgi:DNA-binding NarL/FixJ family response regulator